MISQADALLEDYKKQMSRQASTLKIDPGLFALMMILRSHGSAVEVEVVRDLCETDKVGIAEMLRCARALGFKAYPRNANWHVLASMPLPLVASLRDGGFISVVKAVGDDFLVVRPGSPPGNLKRAELQTICDGRLVVIARGGRFAMFAERYFRPLGPLLNDFAARLTAKSICFRPSPYMQMREWT